MKLWLCCILTLVLQLKVQGFTIVTNVNTLDWVDGNDELMNLDVVGGFSNDYYLISGGGIEGVWLSIFPSNAISNTWTLWGNTSDSEFPNTYGTSVIVSYLGEEVNLQSFSDNPTRVLLDQHSRRGASGWPVQVTQSQFYITSYTGSYEQGDDYFPVPGNRTQWGWGLFEINYSGELTLLDSYSIWDTRFDNNNITYSERLNGIVTGEESFLIVPEPKTYALLLGGTVLGYVFLRRRK